MNKTLTRIGVGASLIGMLCAVAVVAVVAGSALAQSYPSRQIEFVAQSSPGGGTDLFMRNITELLRKDKTFSQPLITSNRTGGGGVVAYFVQAPDIPTAKELGFNIIAAVGRGFAMPADVPKEAAVAMETALKRVYDSPAYKEYSHRNMFDSNYLDPAGFAKYLAVNRLVQEEFLRAIGVVK